MLGADLVRARRRGENLHLIAIKGTEMPQILQMASELLALSETCVGQNLEDVNEALGAVARESRHEKIWAGLKKLMLDDCGFGTPLDVDAPALRKDVFVLASKMRRELVPEATFQRLDVLREIAEKLEVEPQAVEDGLFGDLKGAALLTRSSSLSPEGLVERYELAQIQGVLLRAVRLTAVVECGGVEATRSLFQKLKFRQLLYRMEQLSEGTYRLEIEGPFSLFESVTKYGLALALLVPSLMEFKSAQISADLRWGKDREPLKFETKLATFPQAHEGQVPLLRGDVATLVESIRKKDTHWSVEVCSDLLDIPGVGLCVPDIKFSAKGRKPVYLEVLGFWSRDAVWKRVEWAEGRASSGRKKKEHVLFAVSSRLRVKQEVLPEKTGSALYVYKGRMNAATILAQLDVLSALA